MSIHLFIADLQKHVRGQVFDDELHLGIYSTDASLYQIKPIAVFVPVDAKDVCDAVGIAHDHKIPIIARGGGTGLAGQTIGNGLIIDFTPHLNQILEINLEECWARVQPGVIRDQINTAVAVHGLQFAPDPATTSRAAIGGMIANNSSGTNSLIYGKTIDHVLGLKILLSDGTILETNSMSRKAARRISGYDSREGNIYRLVLEQVEQNRDEIMLRYPKVMRRVGGYNLDELLDEEEFDLSKIIVGSEGTLGIILEAKINLIPLPGAKCSCLAHFSSMRQAIQAVPDIITYHPAAVEIIDHTVISFSRKNIQTRDSCKIIEGDPEAVLIIEFYGDSMDEVMEIAHSMVKSLVATRQGYAFPIFQPGKAYDDLLTVRKKGLGLMMGMKSKRKPAAFIEDAAIPLPHLADYVIEVDSICRKYGVQLIKYAHASVGVIHLRPVLDMRKQKDIDLFKKIAEETFSLVKKYKGSWSGEHGDGLVRSPFNQRFFGDQLYNVFDKIKSTFDPSYLLNPGKIISSDPIDANLRYGTNYQDLPFDAVYHWREEGSFSDEVHMCSGVGECRKVGTGTMCPSFMATRDELHCTRGRANILRLAMSGQLGSKGLADPQVLHALDLCLSCKACKAECPTNVDMSKLKSEVLQHHYGSHGISRRAKLIRDSGVIAGLVHGKMARAINLIQRSNAFKYLLEKLIGFDARRVLPPYAKTSIINWYKSNYEAPAKPIDTVILFLDTYIKYHEPEVGISTIKLLTECGIAVKLADVGCCQRPRISNGFLHLAKKEGGKVVTSLLDHPSQHTILVCEPSCASALQFDLPDLIDDPSLCHDLQTRIKTVAGYLAEKLSDISTVPTLQTKDIVLHGHCHEKALYDMESIRRIVEKSGGTLQVIDSGCCGMAGAFGYEVEHYRLSQTIYMDRLGPQVESLTENTMLIANGFSCRHQIEHFSQKKAKFWTQIFI